MPGQESLNSEVYADLVEQGTMQNFSLLLSKFSKANTDLIKALLNILLNFSAFIDPLATENPAKPDNIIAIEAFVQGNIIGRILKVVITISEEFEGVVEVKDKSMFQSVYADFRNIIYTCLSILGNLCASPGRDEASTMPRFEIFKTEVFDISSHLIRSVFAVHDLYSETEDCIDLELVDSITYFLANVLQHL